MYREGVMHLQITVWCEYGKWLRQPKREPHPNMCAPPALARSVTAFVTR